MVDSCTTQPRRERISCTRKGQVGGWAGAGVLGGYPVPPVGLSK